MKLEIPTLLLNEQICRKNIRHMAQKAREAEVSFRPHFKTHQSAEIGEWYRHEGVSKITTSSLTMAEYFANAGWKDILVAFPANILEINSINILASKIDLSLLIESDETLNFLVKNLKKKVNIHLKIDTGYHRTGISWDNFDTIQSMIELISRSANMEFTGFVTHSGQTYQAKSPSEIIQIHHESLRKLSKLKTHFSSERFIPCTSIGDTPSCSIADTFEGIDEIRPGNFVFYDVMQSELGSCDIKDIAVAIACPVVAVHPERKEAVIYGGAIHLSKEFIVDSHGNKVFGLVALLGEEGWTEPLPGNFVSALSQEHGIISLSKENLSAFKPGDVICVLPIHSCLAAHHMRSFMTLQGKQIATMNS